MVKPTYTSATAPGALPLLGHAVPLLRGPLDFLSSLPARGDLVRVRIGPFRAVVVCDPELTRQVLLEDRAFDKGGPLYDRIREVGGNGLGTCPYREHRRQRRLIQPSFHPTRLPGYARVMTGQIATVTRSWHDGRTVDVLAEMMTLTARTAVATMFADGLPPSALGTVMDDFATVMAGITRRALMPAGPDRLPTPGNRRFVRAHARLRRTVRRIIAERRAERTDHGDLLSALLAARDAAGGGAARGFSDAEIDDQILTFFIAGTETTASTLAWALHALGHHPRLARRLRAEADAVLGGAPATLEHLPRLDLTGRIVTESLRLYPPVWLLTRVATADTRLGGHTVPAGTTVAFSPYLLHRRPDLYADPGRFDPDRWSAAGEAGPGAQRPRGAFVPFGGGARKCIGDAFGRTEATLALASIAAAWRLEPVPGERVRPALGVVMSPRGLRMRTVRRGAPAAPVIRRQADDVPGPTHLQDR
ncbi:cytochrome P450 [Streptomyces sp. NPDC053048]|uniref:cytochrome P450 n=1 Tax=Streptomyces sp. NPDC053048 TaxID=3365694 RepID=UPI0037D7C336